MRKSNNRMRLRETHLSGINLEDLANAMLDPNKRFEFPMKMPSFELAKNDKILLGITLGSIAVGLFANAYINATRK